MNTEIVEAVEVEQKERGFTLVELLIVIVILGILATVTVFAVRGIADKGKSAACDSDKKVLEVAVETFYANGGAAGTATELLLVEAELIRDVSKTYNIGGDGIAVTAETDALVLGDTEPCVAVP
ncbi:MAG: prepilin-type N-terminal cleavage/methylation domain-containing protein [Ilumatobacteraceae bacterium]|nr:prepilin-type N-terminal cleavage/methylation domain-containing protein [Ilumatobacteraceae bacterium]